MRPLLIALLLMSCGRPLTDSEVAFTQAIQGPQAPRFARVVEGLPFAPERTVPVRARTTCQQRIWPAPEGQTVTVSPLAAVVFNDIYIKDGVYTDDFMPNFPDSIYLPAAMLFGHEMVHVWQWQNRDLTGYHPLRAAYEHVTQRDPYLINPETSADFLSFGYEQQGAMMEEYICCRALAPEAARTVRLHGVLSEYFALPPLSEPLAQNVRVPYPELVTPQICDP